MTAIPEFGQVYLARQPDQHSDVVITSLIGNEEKVRIVDYDTGKHRLEIPTSLLNAHYRPEEKELP